MIGLSGSMATVLMMIVPTLDSSWTDVEMTVVPSGWKTGPCSLTSVMVMVTVAGDKREHIIKLK